MRSRHRPARFGVLRGTGVALSATLLAALLVSPLAAQTSARSSARHPVGQWASPPAATGTGAVRRTTGPSDEHHRLVLVPVRVADVMDSAEVQRTGIARLSAAERAALDAWLTRYSAELARAEEGAQQAQRGRGPFRRGYAAPLAVPTTAPTGARLVATPVEGNYVRLADGTLWEVYLPDRAGTVTWRAGDYVTVSRAAAGVGEFDHVLVNGAARTRAFARFVELTPPRRR